MAHRFLFYCVIQVKDTLGIRKQNPLRATNSSAEQDDNAKHGSQTSSEEGKQEQSGSKNTADSFFGKFKSTISSPNVSSTLQKLKEAKLVNIAKQGYDIVKEELSSSPTKRRHAPSAPSGETSTRTELVVVPSKQSVWGKKWEQFKDKVTL